MRCIVKVIIDPDAYLYHARPHTASNNGIVQSEKLFTVPILIERSM